MARISFDLDDTLICYSAAECEPRLPWYWRVLLRDEPLRRGAIELARELRRRGHEVWIYTTSNRSALRVRWWLLAHGIRVTRVINGIEHDRCFGVGTVPTKRPHAFGIDLHVDDSPGVEVEARQHGFAVCIIDRQAADWCGRVLRAVALETTKKGASPHDSELRPSQTSNPG